MRPLRYLPPGHLVEVTSRTIHGRPLLRPDHPTCDLIRGVLGRAQALYRMRIVAFVFLSNHFHLLLLPDSPQQLAAFMGYLASNIAREVGRVRQWHETFWSRRYRAITISTEDEAQIARLRYVLAHWAKEGFVARPRDWPGPHAIPALLEGAPIGGSKRSRAPAFHAATHAARQRLKEAYRAFVNAFWRASERLRSGDRSAVFPEGSFPPALPYVPIPTG